MKLRWSKKEKCIEATWEKDYGSNASLMLHLFNGETIFKTKFIDELKARGYDLTTFKFSIEKAK